MPARKGKEPDDTVQLEIGGALYQGWQEVRVTRGIERCPADFHLRVTEKYEDGFTFPIMPGQSCRLRFGSDVVLEGWVDRYVPSIGPGAHEVTVQGRSKAADLVDCSSTIENGTQVAAVSALALATKLAAPYGVTATGPATSPRVIPQFNIILGETPFDVIERVARFVGLLVYDGPDGNLVLAEVGKVAAASGFEEGVNVQSADVLLSMDQRFSEYLVVLTSADFLGSRANALQSDANYNVIGRSTDPGVTRRRVKIIVGEAAEDVVIQAQRQADWEKARRYGRSQAVNITTDSWRDSAGMLWTPNTTARVHLPTLNLLERDWVIAEVTYRLNMATGTQADLVLMPSEAFTLAPTIILPFDWQRARDLREGGVSPAGPR